MRRGARRTTVHVVALDSGGERRWSAAESVLAPRGMTILPGDRVCYLGAGRFKFAKAKGVGTYLGAFEVKQRRTE